VTLAPRQPPNYSVSGTEQTPKTRCRLCRGRSAHGGGLQTTRYQRRPAVSTTSTPSASILSPEALLEHWQGHRRLTRRVIEAFPEDELFSFTIGSMRTFGEIARELLAMAAPMACGVATGEWESYTAPEATSREALLRL